MVKNTVVILGIDAFLRKNRYQLELLNERGFRFDVFTGEALCNPSLHMQGLYALNNLFVLKRGFFARVLQIYLYLRSCKNTIHHAEIYATGRFSYFYVILCKYFNIKFLVVERGDLQFLKSIPFFYRALIRRVYQLADVVWYKEPYMAGLLREIGVKNSSMIPNSVASPVIRCGEKKIDFLWVNRIIKERRFDWVMQYFLNCAFNAQVVALGLLPKHVAQLSKEAKDSLIRLKMSEKFQIFECIDPIEYYWMAKYFILPSRIVFGNHSLLEAMSYGVVPIVSKTEATNLIVQDGYNGIVFNHTFEDFALALNRAWRLDEENYSRLSAMAKKTICEKFSQSNWGDQVEFLYKTII
ncbi:MAG: hypothetical protein A2X77_04730 [Gammaproteobacteria bacterium GWE2_42_36]|nr:MAG: hypothetical protein A2X77_04730 [Gammaproteobacteria bacterium GWE2_42_36]